MTRKDEMELVELYDEDNKECIGVAEREQVHENSLWHREVMVMVINEKNEVLLQRRSLNKKHGAGNLSVVAGHIDPGEKEIVAALRELKEEVGLDICEKNIKFTGVYKDEREGNRCYCYTYLVRTDKKIEELEMQKEEVSELLYVSMEELEERMRNKEDKLSLWKRPYIKEVMAEIKK